MLVTMVASSSDGIVYFGFVYDIISAYNGHRYAMWKVRILKLTYQDAELDGAESDAYDCLFMMLRLQHGYSGACR